MTERQQRMVGILFEFFDTGFAQGVEEGFVRAAELTDNPDAILRKFRPVKPQFERRETGVTGRRTSAARKMKRGE